jgi:hypothetical protein
MFAEIQKNRSECNQYYACVDQASTHTDSTEERICPFPTVRVAGVDRGMTISSSASSSISLIASSKAREARLSDEGASVLERRYSAIEPEKSVYGVDAINVAERNVGVFSLGLD